MKNNKLGFTLVELLVVVLIIGILAAIALPMYQKAVLKSRFAALMPIAKAMADSNEAYYLEHGQYATAPQDLPVQGQSDYDDGTQIDLVADEDYSYTIAYNPSKLPDNNYIVFQKHSSKFTDTTMCEARDEAAGQVCLALGGTSLSGGVTDGWTAYLLSGDAAGSNFCHGAQPATQQYSGGITGTSSCNGNSWQYTWEGPNGVVRGYRVCWMSYCRNAIFVEGGRCFEDGRDGCTGTIIVGGGICIAKNGDCGGATYVPNEYGVTGCCMPAQRACADGVPVCGAWNEETHAYDIAD